MRRPLWCSAFLVALESEYGNVSRAADRVGRHPAQVYRRRKSDVKFAEAMDAAFERIELDLRALVSRRSA